MGLSSSVNKPEIKKNNYRINNNYFEAYKSMEFILKSISKFKNCTLKDIFLISTKSIPIFIKYIEQSLILENLKNKNFISYENSENILNDLFQQYTKEKNMVFYKDYQLCKQLIGKNDENEFIFVDESFFTNMLYNYKELNKFRNYNVILNIFTDKNNTTIMKIKFPISNKTLYIQEKKFGFFKFIDNYNNTYKSENEYNKSNGEIEINTLVSNYNLANKDDNIKRSISNNVNNKYNKIINESKKKFYLDNNQCNNAEKNEEFNNMNYNNNIQFNQFNQFNQQKNQNNNFYKEQKVIARNYNNNCFNMSINFQNPYNFNRNNNNYNNYNNGFINNNF